MPWRHRTRNKYADTNSCNKCAEAYENDGDSGNPHTLILLRVQRQWLVLNQGTQVTAALRVSSSALATMTPELPCARGMA
jgi:hypothetical protein